MLVRIRVRHAVELAERKMSEDITVKNSDIEQAINEYVRNQRNREILKRRLIDGVVFEGLAEEFDLSTRQIKRIVYKEQEKIFAHLPL